MKKYTDNFIDDLVKRVDELEYKLEQSDSCNDELERLKEDNADLEKENEGLRNRLKLIENILEDY